MEFPLDFFGINIFGLHLDFATNFNFCKIFQKQFFPTEFTPKITSERTHSFLGFIQRGSLKKIK